MQKTQICKRRKNQKYNDLEKRNMQKKEKWKNKKLQKKKALKKHYILKKIVENSMRNLVSHQR